MASISGTVLLIQDNQQQETLLSTAFLSNNITVRKIKPDQDLLPQLHSQMAIINGPVLICADLARLAKNHLIWPQFTNIVRGISAEIGLLATTSRHIAPNVQSKNWVRKHGGFDFIGSLSVLRLNNSMSPVLKVISDFFGVNANSDRLRDYADALLNSKSEDEDIYSRQQKTWARLEGLGQSPESIIEMMANSGEVQSLDRTYRMKKYPHCFLGSEATKWLIDHLGVSANQAVDVGELLRSMGYFYHVAKDQPFHNGNYFYRFSLPSQSAGIVDIDRIIEEGHLLRGFDIKDRTWRGQIFRNTFVGNEATKWLATFYGLGMHKAIVAGQILLDLFIFRHVTDGHEFIDSEFFYRLTRDK